MALLLGVPASAAETDHGRAIRSPVPAPKVSAYDSSMMSERAFPESLPSLRDAPDPPPPTAQTLPEIEAPSLVLPRSRNSVDSVWQAAPSRSTSTLPTPFVFSGIQGTTGVTPPDTVGAVGAAHYVQLVNLQLEVFNKSSKTVAVAVKNMNALWTGYTGTNAGNGCASRNDGDPIVVYDKAAGRWVISQFSLPHQSTSGGPSFLCVAVSKTSDATGAYWLYDFSYSHTINNYPKLSVWPDAYYATFDMFDSVGASYTFVGPALCAYDRTAMLSGSVATQKCFQLASTAYSSVLPADLDGSSAPPPGAPNYLLGLNVDSLDLWQFHVDFATPANSTLSGPVNIPVAPFTPACANGTACVPQPGTSQKLDGLGYYPMFRLAYRNLGDHESLLASHSVTTGGVTGVRWYELRSPGSTPVVYQQSTFAPADGAHRWMPSMAMDHQGGIAIGYSVSDGTSTLPSIRYAGRLAGDALSTMETEASIYTGTAVESGASRWGDYSAMTVDPVDDCTFWYTNEYYATTGVSSWATKIGVFALPNCGPTAAPTIDAAFGVASIALGSTTSLTLTIANPNSGPQLSGLAFNDVLPAGVAAVSTNSNTCSGNLVVSNGSIVLSNGALAASASCVISIQVQAVATGTQNDDVTIASTEGGAGNTAHASLTVGKASTATTLSTSCMTTFVAGQSFTIHAAVAGFNATGSVDFSEGANALCAGVALASGAADCTTSALTVPLGDKQHQYLLSASYGGDTNNNASVSNTVSVTVLAAGDVIFRNGLEATIASCPSH